MKTIELNVRESELLAGALGAAAQVYRNQIPPAHQADQVAPMAVNATMLTTASLDALRNDFSRAMEGGDVRGPIGITYADDDMVDGDDPSAHELTLVYDDRPTSQAHLIWQAVWLANQHLGRDHAETMALLERLI